MTSTSSPSAETMLPCPFCGSAPELYTVCDGDGVELEFMFRCEECGVEQSAEWKHDAVAAWNRRALPVPTQIKAGETLPAAFVDRKGNLSVPEGSPLAAMLKALPDAPFGEEVLPLFVSALPIALSPKPGETIGGEALEAACEAYNAFELGSDVDHVRKIISAYLAALTPSPTSGEVAGAAAASDDGKAWAASRRMTILPMSPDDEARRRFAQPTMQPGDGK